MDGEFSAAGFSRFEERRQRHLDRRVIAALPIFVRLGEMLIAVALGQILYEWFPGGSDAPFWPNYGCVITLSVLFATMLFELMGAYREPVIVDPAQTLRVFSLAALALGLVAVPIILMVRGSLYLSGTWTVTWVAGWYLVSASGRYTVARLVSSAVARGQVVETVAVVGANPWTGRLVSIIETDGDARARVVGVFDDRRSRLPESIARFTQPVSALIELGKSARIDRVVIALPVSAERRIMEIADHLKSLAVQIEVCPDLSSYALLSHPVRLRGDVPYITIAQRPLDDGASLIKSLLDRLLATVLLVAIAPTLLLIALLIKLDSTGPVLFRQRRHGFNNREIEVWKFRTMRVEVADSTGGRQTRRGDDRITRVGAVLRRTSIDELPQLFNVLRGEMSLVGPRPHPIGMRTQDMLCHEIVRDYAHRHRVKPGITGWAQVNGYRGATETPSDLRKRVEHDLFYIENWSLSFDLKILLLTVLRVFNQKNAY